MVWEYEGRRDIKELFRYIAYLDPRKAQPLKQTQQEPLKSKVIELDQQNFESSIQNGNWLLEFYAPW